MGRRRPTSAGAFDAGPGTKDRAYAESTTVAVAIAVAATAAAAAAAITAAIFGDHIAAQPISAAAVVTGHAAHLAPARFRPQSAVAVATAEAAARRRPRGWSTSRHYAVPGAVHTDPGLLQWYRRVLRGRLRPMLQEAFPGRFGGARCNGSNDGARDGNGEG